jgi:hypothetical protein
VIIWIVRIAIHLDRKPQAMQTCEIRDLLLYELDTRAYRACFISSTVLSGLPIDPYSAVELVVRLFPWSVSSKCENLVKSRFGLSFARNCSVSMASGKVDR